MTELSLARMSDDLKHNRSALFLTIKFAFFLVLFQLVFVNRAQQIIYPSDEAMALVWHKSVLSHVAKVSS